MVRMIIYTVLFDLNVGCLFSGGPPVSKPPTSKIAPSTRIPQPPKVFEGREVIVNEIATHLASGNPERMPVCILAPGGMGKTSTSLAAMNHPLVTSTFPPHRQIWVPCIGLSSPTAFLTYLAQALKIEVQGDPLLLLKLALDQPRKPYIILIDNFETTWHQTGGKQVEIENILKELDAIPELGILLSMRSEYAPLAHWTRIKLQPLDINSALDVWGVIHPAGRRPRTP
jgi:hypothetical protein